MRLGLIGVIAMAIATNAFAQDQAAVVRGEKVYADTKCAICHSVAAQGNKKGPLEGVGKLPAAELREWITNAPAMAAKAKKDRKPPMKAYVLAPDDLAALTAYLQTLK